MTSVVIFDSQFGNTERVARAIGAGLEALGAVRVVPVADAGSEVLAARLLVVGSPTQMHGLGRHELHHLLERLGDGALDGKDAAAFDTRLRGAPSLTGRASLGLAQRLQTKGARLVVPPESFLVAASEGPLAPGEEERAGAWAGAILARLTSATAASPILLG